MDAGAPRTVEELFVSCPQAPPGWGAAPWRLGRFGGERARVEWRHHALRLRRMFPDDTDVVESAFEQLLIVRILDDTTVTAAALAVDVWCSEGLSGEALSDYCDDLRFLPVEDLYRRIRGRISQLGLPLRESLEPDWPARLVSALQLPELGLDVGARSRLRLPPTEWREWELLPSALRLGLARCDLLEDPVLG